MENKTLESWIPGDCHAHMILDGVYFRDAINLHKEAVQEDYVRQVLSQYQAAGVTYVRDGGDSCGVCLRASQLAQEYGIEYRMPVFAMHRKGRYGSIVGFPYEDLKEYVRMVQKAKSLGADFIKVMVSGILDFHQVGLMSCEPLPPEEIRQLVDIAHSEGLAIMLHINGSETIMAAVEAGADSLEHGFYMNEECCLAVAEHPETMWIPSISPVANQLDSGRFPREVLAEITAWQQQNVRRVVEAGGRVALGSDAGAYLVPHVSGIQDEMRYLKEALKEIRTEEEIQKMLWSSEQWIRERFRRS